MPLRSELFVLAICLVACVSPSASAMEADGLNSPGARAPFIAVEQDGKMFSSVNGEVTLRRAPFVLVLRLPEIRDIVRFSLRSSRQGAPSNSSTRSGAA